MLCWSRNPGFCTLSESPLHSLPPIDSMVRDATRPLSRCVVYRGRVGWRAHAAAYRFRRRRRAAREVRVGRPRCGKARDEPALVLIRPTRLDRRTGWSAWSVAIVVLDALGTAQEQLTLARGVKDSLCISNGVHCSINTFRLFIDF